MSHTGNPPHILLRENVSFQIVDFEWNIAHVSCENNSLFIATRIYFNIYILLIYVIEDHNFYNCVFYCNSKVGNNRKLSYARNRPQIIAEWK